MIERVVASAELRRADQGTSPDSARSSVRRIDRVVRQAAHGTRCRATGTSGGSPGPGAPERGNSNGKFI
jgi:hypothetical protein